MASPSIVSFHNQQAMENRERLNLRLHQGTKASTPGIRNVRRSEPGFYSNPLPDNSSGSKIRPFQCSKDESGRPNAMEKVLMRQRGMLTGGVLKDYRYARKILDQRARDTTNINLEAEGLPPQAQPIPELSRDDSLAMELNQVLQNVVSAIEGGYLSQLTISELKVIPRLLLQLLPNFDVGDIQSLTQFIDDDILSVLRNLNMTEADPEYRILKVVMDYFQNIREYLREIAPSMGLDRTQKLRAIVALAKDFFGRSIISRAEERRLQLEAVAQRPKFPAPTPQPVDTNAPQVAQGITTQRETLPQAYQDFTQQPQLAFGELFEPEAPAPTELLATTERPSRVVRLDSLQNDTVLPLKPGREALTVGELKGMRRLIYGRDATPANARALAIELGKTPQQAESYTTGYWKAKVKNLVYGVYGYDISSDYVSI